MLTIKNHRIRKIIHYAVPFVLIPSAVIAGTIAFEGKRYIFISLAAAILAFLLFVSGYEKKRIGTRRMVICAVMTALCCIGRLIPFFKPVAALTVITGMYLGSESGFLVGSLSALISDFYFGQGPWTPFQMFAWGIIGYIAGKISDPLKKNRPLLLIYGVIAGIFYSFFMDIWTTLWYSGGFDMNIYLSALVTALPYTIMYCISNFVFLFAAAKPFCEKLERIRVKYGI